jgi:hypothetical protein
MTTSEIIDIIKILGGARRVATHVNVDPATVKRWPKNKTGIPEKYWPNLEALGKEYGITIPFIKAVHDRAINQ